MKLSKPNHTPRLRRRTAATTRIELLRNYGLVLLLFGTLVVFFTPPTTDENRIDAIIDEQSAVARHGAAITFVACEVSTPHSKHPETAPGGRFVVAILNEDVDRNGSSAEAFLKLVDDKFYDGNYVFRVIKGFIAQWGHRADKQKADPAKQRIPESDVPTKGSNDAESDVDVDTSSDKDAARTQKLIRLLRRKNNVRGTMTMILGGTGQVFVNYGDNTRLDKDGTIPFGVILEQNSEDPNRKDSGMALFDSIGIDPYKGGQGQMPAIHKHTVPTDFPEMSRIDRCYKLEE